MMSTAITPGRRLRAAIEEERPLQVAGAINAYSALLAERAGFRALYLSGAGVANAALGWPDLGFTRLEDVLTEARRIAAASPLPLLVDADTGWEDGPGIEATVQGMEQAGVAGLHLEDQVAAKRCGHRPGKVLVSRDAMVTRIRTAIGARRDPALVIMARTDAASVEGLDAALDRARAYVDAGADMIFAEALTGLEQFRMFTAGLGVPVLANMTEFGRTPMFTVAEFREAGVGLVLYPLTAFRAMSAAAVKVYETLRKAGTQRGLLESMQTRDELYEVLDYEAAEERINRVLKGHKDER